MSEDAVVDVEHRLCPCCGHEEGTYPLVKLRELVEWACDLCGFVWKEEAEEVKHVDGELES